jgi:hypothetical protein
MENDLYETYGVPDTFCEGLARMDQLGPCHRLTFAIRDCAGSGRIIAAKLILPSDRLVDIAGMIAARARALPYAPDLLVLPMSGVPN